MAPKPDIRNYFEQISVLQNIAEEKCKIWQKSIHEYQTALLLRLSDIVREVSEHVGDSQELTIIKCDPKAEVSKRGPGRPPKAESTKYGTESPPKAEAVKRGPGRPAKAERENENSPKLKKVVWDILCKGSFYLRKNVTDYPPEARGLKVSELKEIIEKSENLTTSSENTVSQIQNALYSLREAKKIDRNDEDRRYFIIKNAQYDS